MGLRFRPQGLRFRAVGLRFRPQGLRSSVFVFGSSFWTHPESNAGELQGDVIASGFTFV